MIFLCFQLSAWKVATSFRIFAPGIITIKVGNFRHMAKVCTIKSDLKYKRFLQLVKANHLINSFFTETF